MAMQDQTADDGARAAPFGAAPAQLAYAYAKDHGVVVLEAGSAARVGLRAGADPRAILEARRVLGQRFAIETLQPAAFDKHLSEIYGSKGLDADALPVGLDEAGDLSSLASGVGDTADLLDSNDNAPIVRLINGIFAEAIKRKASDIHIETYEDRLIVRFRQDGAMREALRQDRRLAPLLVSRIKVMAKLDIAEKRVPQDGRISLALGGKTVDVRVSTLPSRYSERVVMRLLDKEQAQLSLEDLGMEGRTLERFKRRLREPNGVVLVTGPTGSGKTTTLYAGLRLLNDGSNNILTVEDPVEYGLEGVGQTQVNPKVGMTFAAGLRAILRQDPDIVMVGEIRDGETAEIAVQASLTGHLVLSTVHTNDSAAAVTRLRDMGVEPFLLSSTLKAVLAQRLVRRLCEQCKEPYEPAASEWESIGVAPRPGLKAYRGAGCPSCNGAGFRGRLGLYELLVVDETVKKLIHEDAPEQAIVAHAFKNDPTLLQAGAEHVLAGRTTIEEVIRVCRQSGEGDGGV